MNIERLNLNGNDISDVSSLSKLIKLTSIDLGFTKVSNINSLSNAT
ncbi:hypothetical protein GW750_05630 [bacterium]|nr:hypothetical protein [bacterium]